MTDIHISKATANNWQRLHTDHDDRLTLRANKTRSGRRVAAWGYLDATWAQSLLNQLSAIKGSVGDIVYSLCVSKLKAKGIYEKAHVQQALAPFKDTYQELTIDLTDEWLQNEADVLGFAYQSLITEGERNSTGQYYTHHEIVSHMLNHLTLKEGERFLDPCCGSGAFLMGVKTSNPEQLVGYDIHPLAVLMARTNLLTKYADHSFSPQVYCRDFLTSNEPVAAFDYIYTNPPWGTDREGKYHQFPLISSKEKSSMVLLKALQTAKPQGKVCLLLPTSLLKIKKHGDIRQLMIHQTTIQRINLYKGRFDGVFTDFFSILLIPQKATFQRYIINDEIGDFCVSLSSSQLQRNLLVTVRQTPFDHSIMQKIEALRHDDLSHSEWALGIITGNNKEILHPQASTPDYEPVFTGREVMPFKLGKPQFFVHFNPAIFQQCAPEMLYRAKEKLIYRFIAHHPIVAYDNQQRLCLNSANVLIPAIDGMSVKSVCALLNSRLYHYYYRQLFSDIKILKGNLKQLPFPRLTPEQDLALSSLVDEAPASLPAINAYVYAIFGISEEEQRYLEAAWHSPSHKRKGAAMHTFYR